MRKPKETVENIRGAAQAMERDMLRKLEGLQEINGELMDEVNELKDRLESAEANLHFNRMKVSHLEGYIQRVREQEGSLPRANGRPADGAKGRVVSQTSRDGEWSGL